MGLGFLTTHYTQIGEPDHALTCGQRTLAIATNLEDVGLTVTAQHNLGQVYRNLGDYRRAVACYQRTWRVSTASSSVSASACLVWPL